MNVDSHLSESAGDRGLSQARYGSPKARHGRGGGSPTGRPCYVCNALSHVARNYPRGRGGRGYYRGNTRGYPRRAQVNLCTTMELPHKNDVSTQCEVDVDLVDVKWEFAEHPVVESVTSADVTPQVRIYPLQYVKVNVAGVECNALKDSGCQIPVVSTRLFD